MAKIQMDSINKTPKRHLKITGENLNVIESKEEVQIPKETQKLDLTKSKKKVRISNVTMQLVLIVAIMIIILTPMIVIIISLMTGFNDTVVTQAFALFSNLSAIVIGGFLGRLTGENQRNFKEKE